MVQDQMKTTDRKKAALALRSAGLSYKQIAERLGFTPQAAHKAVKTALEAEITPLVEELRLVELNRLDMLQAAAWKDAMQGHLGAIKTMLSVMERRARLLGLDAPTKTDLTSDGQPVKAYTILANPESWDSEPNPSTSTPV